MGGPTVPGSSSCSWARSLKLEPRIWSRMVEGLLCASEFFHDGLAAPEVGGLSPAWVPETFRSQRSLAHLRCRKTRVRCSSPRCTARAASRHFPLGLDRTRDHTAHLSSCTAGRHYSLTLCSAELARRSQVELATLRDDGTGKLPIGLRIRGHLTGPPSAQDVIMIGPLSPRGHHFAEAGTQVIYFQALREQNPVLCCCRWNGYWAFL